jgi:hypothetical protein
MFKGTVVGVVFAALASLNSVVIAGEKYKLDEPVDDVRVFGCGTRVDVTGKTQPSPNVEPLKLNASAALSYRERRLLGPGVEAEAFRSIRDYETTQSDIVVGTENSAAKLDDRLKMIVAQGRVDGVELYSLGGNFTSNELDLLRSPADSLALIALLPAKEVEVGDKWVAPGWAFQMLTAIDAIAKGELNCSLASVEKQVARIKLEGKLEGAATGAISEITVTGFYEYDLKDRCISQCDFTQVEKRGFGPVSPAFEFTARVRLLRKVAQLPGRLSEQKYLDAALEEPKASLTALRFESPWNIGLEYPRHWHLWKIQEKAAIFRLIDEGSFVAQCDLAPIASAKPGEHLPEVEFQRDIRQALGDRLKEMGQGEAIKTTDRSYVYRVTASGADGDRPLTWIFYLIADPSGRQASLSITVDTPHLESLASRERELIDTLRFGPAPVIRTTGK